MIKSSHAKTLVLTVFGLCFSSLVLAHTGATGIVKERMEAMKDMGKKSKVVAGMLKGKTAFEKSALMEAADSFVLHGSQMKDQFPNTEHSRTGSKTEALPEIWEDKDRFNKDIDEFILLSETLQELLSTTDDQKALKAAFLQTAKSCSGCHKQFRKAKK